MSTSVRLICLVGCLALNSCNEVVDIFPFEQCPERPVVVELQPDRASDLNAYFDTDYHSTAGCTIIFHVKRRRFFFDTYAGPDAQWEPIGGFEYELRIEPEGPLGLLEEGVLPEDGVLTVPTVAGNTVVRLTVHQPEPESDETFDVIATVYLDEASGS